MYGKDIAEQQMKFRTYRLRLLQTNLNCRYGMDQIPVSQQIRCTTTEAPSVDNFLHLYNKVGKDWQWYMLNYVDRDDMEAYCDQQVLVTLTDHGEPIGFGSFEDNRKDTNITYFGSSKEGIGRGLGRNFLSHVARKAFSYHKKESLWLYTTDRDHPNALTSYMTIGFHVEDVRNEYHWAPISVFKKDEI